MKYKAEIFDKIQYLYEETKFNDHQLHAVIRFDGKLDEDVLRKAVMMLLETVPVLSCVYHHNNGEDYWEKEDYLQFGNVLTAVNDETAFDEFTVSKIDETDGPQIKLCLYQSSKDSLSVIMNHMVCDAAGFKQCLYLLSDIYSNMIENPEYRPSFKIDGDRSVKEIMRQIPLKSRLKSLLFGNGESNQNSKLIFPLSRDKNVFPFILTHEIDSDKFIEMREYCKKNGVTINDVMLGAYCRALFTELKMKSDTLSIPIMIDMRRYLKDSSFGSLSNLSSTVIMNIPIKAEDKFDDTVLEIGRQTRMKKSAGLGINGFVKLNMIFRLFNEKSGYKLTKGALKNPAICMTNIGIIDDEKLSFKGTHISNAFFCGSIKYRPHFQIALSTFADKMTITSNLYGSRQDYEKITRFLTLVEAQLPVF